MPHSISKVTPLVVYCSPAPSGHVGAGVGDVVGVDVVGADVIDVDVVGMEVVGGDVVGVDIEELHRSRRAPQTVGSLAGVPRLFFK